jgi:CheY-like chemotaxis protein
LLCGPTLSTCGCPAGLLKSDFWMAESAHTVLIVDDDPQILRLVEKMMCARPFKILAVPRPSAALRILERESVHMLISDIAMPEMDGNKLAEKVLALYPDTPILLISGHARGTARVAAGSVRVGLKWRPSGTTANSIGCRRLPGARCRIRILPKA